MQRIKEWAVEDRPREKLFSRGPEHLTNAELVAILLGSGSRNMSALDLSRYILNDLDNELERLNNCSIQDLMVYSGIGAAKAVTIVAALEISRRVQSSSKSSDPVIRSSNSAFEILRPRLCHLKHEEFYAIYLSRANKVLKMEQISKGGLSGTIADGKVIFNHALINRASAIILAHNHPSGQLKPSEADLKLTKRLQEFGQLINLQILDHLILTRDNYFSFADEGLM